MNSKYDFYEIVIIKTIKPNLKKYNGCEVIIIGKSQSEKDPNIWAYSVSVPDKEENIFVLEEDVHSTGKVANREDFYTGESIIVKIDPGSEEGYLEKE